MSAVTDLVMRMVRTGAISPERATFAFHILSNAVASTAPKGSGTVGASGADAAPRSHTGAIK